jgi:energy-coupling factor transport system ATP-binding protein
MIRLDGVSYTYPAREEQRPVLNNLDLEIREGEFVAIVGANGSGKSTLAKLINGLLLPTAGSVTVGPWQTTDAEQLADVRQLVGMIFQNPENQFVATSVLDDVAFGLENIGYPPERMGERIEEVLTRVDMWAYRHAGPHQLSGGQKQRVAIAAVLAMQPRVIIFDEATSMLDPTGRADIRSLMAELHAEGFTLITITHDMDEALMASRMIVLHDGHVLLDGEPLDVFEDERCLHLARLELPFHLEVEQALRAAGFRLPKTKNVDELVEQLCR